MKIFVINLKKDIEKREKVEAQLKDLELKYEIIEAVNGKDLSDDELEKLVKDYKNCYLTKGEIGCALSHQMIYKKMIKEDLHHCLILEDDIIIKPQTKEFLKEMDEFLQNKNNFVAILYKAREYYSNRKIELKSKIKLFKTRNSKNAHAYIITKNSAKTLLKINSPIILEADHWDKFQNLSFLKIFNSDKNLIVSYDNEAKEFSNLEVERKLNDINRKKYRNAMLNKNLSYKFYRRVFKIFKRPFLKLVENSDEEMIS